MTNENGIDYILQGYKKLYEVVSTLRGENGCAWDRKQTAKSLLPNLIEEAYELLEAVDERDPLHITEELGDLFLLVTMIAYIEAEKDNIRFTEVFSTITEKLIRRHPHVFGEKNIDDPDHIIKQWNEIKRDVEGRDKNKYITDTVPSTLPPLERSYKLQKKVSEYGFDWENIGEVISKLHEEIEELQHEIGLPAEERDEEKIESELGDMLFAAVNIARFLRVDPGMALHATNTKFVKRFGFIQDRLTEQGIPLSAEQMDAMEACWIESKELFP